LIVFCCCVFALFELSPALTSAAFLSLPPPILTHSLVQPAAPPLVSSEVLVETFEEGELISKYIGTDLKYNRKLADLGLHCYLKMLMKDNFIHADLVRGWGLCRSIRESSMQAGCGWHAEE
jgi:hypothetical protein